MDRRPPQYPPPATKLAKEMGNEIRRANRPLARTRRPMDGAFGVIGIVVGVALLGYLNFEMLQPVKWPLKLNDEIVLVFGNVLLLCFLAIMILSRFSHRRIRRFLAGKCPDCGGNLQGATGVCPGCGRSIA